MVSGGMAAAYIIGAVIAAGAAVYSANEQAKLAKKMNQIEDLEAPQIDKTTKSEAAELEALGDDDAASKRKKSAKERFRASEAEKEAQIGTTDVGISLDKTTTPEQQVTGVQIGG